MIQDILAIDTHTHINHGSRFDSSPSSILYDATLDYLKKMADAAKLDNVTLLAGSGYRSYSYQSGLYDAYVKRDGKEEADTYSARAGHSEHQTGLAIDVTDGFKNYLDEDSDGYKWLMKNAHKYGYIVRYTEGDEFITGYQFEPWHVRYLGIEVATDVIESGLTYDEYVARKN